MTIYCALIHSLNLGRMAVLEHYRCGVKNLGSPCYVIPSVMSQTVKNLIKSWKCKKLSVLVLCSWYSPNTLLLAIVMNANNAIAAL